jgi:hypothetical protein
MWSFLVYSKILLSQPIDIEAVYNNRRFVRAGASSKLRHELGSSPTDFCGSPNVIFKTGFSVYEQRRRVKHSVESHGIAHLEYTIQVKYEVLRR